MALPICWAPETASPGCYRGTCPGQGCGRRLAKYWTNGARGEFRQEDITLEGGYILGLDGVWQKSGRRKDNYPIRPRDQRKVGRLGYGGLDQPARGPRVEAGAKVRCIDCGKGGVGGVALVTDPLTAPPPPP